MLPFSKLYLKFGKLVRISAWCFHVGFHFEVIPGVLGSPGQDALMLSGGGWDVGLVSTRVGKLEPKMLSFGVLLLLFMS